jgi:lysophospholipase L1-like esterase
MRWARGALAITVVLATAGTACSSSTRQDARRVDASPEAGSKPLVVPRSIVQLGDSIASGEGTLYGYTYDTDSDEWTGGNVDVTWPPPYPDCHVSPDAYVNKVAKSFDAAFQQFACTGASFASGISAAEVASGKTLRPAEFGNWATKQDLNAEYDTAKPDLVIVTLGADDVQFSDIVEDCVKNGYKYYWDIEDLECVDANPGSTIENDFFDFLPTLKKNYSTLVSWIEARAKANDVPAPKIVFTNYANPLPAAGVKCNDTSYLYPDQVQYLASLLAQMNGIIESAIKALNDKNVAMADISKAYQVAGVDHRWCSDDPWAYGLSIYHFTDPDSFYSQAPFHPTPDGQESIAEAVVPTIVKLFDTQLPIDTTTTAAKPATTTTSSTGGPSTTTTSTGAPSTTAAPRGP